MVKPMSRFKTVLRVKQHQEKVAAQQLVQIQDAHLKEKDALDRLNDVREEAVNGAPRFGRARATDIQVQRAFIFKLTKQINNQTTKVDEIRGQEDAKRHELTERAQSRQMVETLDERRKAEELRQADHREQEMIDDVANRLGKDK